MSERTGGAVFAVVAVPALVLGTVLAIPLMFGEQACGPAAVAVDALRGAADLASVPATPVAGYGPEQLANAAAILAAGQAQGFGTRDLTIAVMTAMGESGLRVIDRGDAAGPDSRGLFQQRDNGAWGSYADRMDPSTSAANFFRAMARVKNRDSLEPTIVAHRVQANADPYHYQRYWAPAVEVVEALTGAPTGLLTTDGAATGTCAGTTAGQVNANGWASPGEGPINSPYGLRIHPITGARTLHSGVDLQAGGCDGPIWAAQAGVVIFRGFDSAGNGTIAIDHGNGIVTRYLHEYESGMLVRVGDTVAAGQQIGRVGSSGGSTGCHLHFTVVLNGASVDPVPFMAAVGITLN